MLCGRGFPLLAVARANVDNKLTAHILWEKVYWWTNRTVVAVGLVCLLLFYVIAMVFQLYHGGDMRRRKLEPTLLLTEWIFNLPHHIGMV